MTIKATPDSDMRKLDPQMAQMIAMRLRAGAGGQALELRLERQCCTAGAVVVAETDSGAVRAQDTGAGAGGGGCRYGSFAAA